MKHEARGYMCAWAEVNKDGEVTRAIRIDYPCFGSYHFSGDSKVNKGIQYHVVADRDYPRVSKEHREEFVQWIQDFTGVNVHFVDEVDSCHFTVYERDCQYNKTIMMTIMTLLRTQVEQGPMVEFMLQLRQHFGNNNLFAVYAIATNVIIYHGFKSIPSTYKSIYNTTPTGGHSLFAEHPDFHSHMDNVVWDFPAFTDYVRCTATHNGQMFINRAVLKGDSGNHRLCNVNAKSLEDFVQQIKANLHKSWSNV